MRWRWRGTTELLQRVRSVASRTLGALITLAVVAASGVAQPRAVPLTYHATWFSGRDGLPGLFVSSLAQGRDGYLWMTASGSLVRFDGSVFEVVSSRSFSGVAPVPRAVPRSVAAGGGDSVWVALEGGEFWVRTAGQWRPRFAAPRSISSMALAPGMPVVWNAGSDTAVVGIGSVFSVIPDAGFGFTASDAPSIAIDRQGSPWIILRGQTAARAVSKGEVFGGRRDTVGSSASGGAGAPSRLPLARGRFVVGPPGLDPLGVRERDGWLEIVDPHETVHARIPSAPDMVPRLLTRDGRVVAQRGQWIEVHQASVPVQRIPLPSSTALLSMLEDREGAIWIGTGMHGLLRLRRQAGWQRSVDDAGRDIGIVRTLGAGADGSSLVVASRLYRLQGDELRPLALSAPPAPGSIPTAAMEDANGVLWHGMTLSAGRAVLTAQRQGVELARRVVNSPVLKVLEDTARKAVVWLEEARYCVVARAMPALPERCTALGDVQARDLIVGRDGRYWIGGLRGVRVLSATGSVSYTVDRGFGLSNVRALFEDTTGTIWIGMYGGGLARLRRDVLAVATSEHGLAEDVVSSILEDDAGVLWMGGNQGIHGASRAALNAVLDAGTGVVRAQRLVEADGWIAPETSGWPAHRDREGRLWFPTFGGIIGVPARPPAWSRDRPGELTVDELLVNGLPVPVSDTVVLPAGRRDVELVLAAISLRRRTPERLAYRLEGHTPDWRRLRGVRRALIARVRPGRWRLEIRVEDAAATESTIAVGQAGARQSAVTAARVLYLDVPYRWYERPTTLAMFGLASGLAVAEWFRRRQRALEQRAQRLSDEVEEQTHWLRVEGDRTAAALERASEVGAQLRTLLASKSRVFASLSHELRTPLSLVLGPVRELERLAVQDGAPPEARGHIGALRAAVRRLERLTDQFLDLADVQAGTVALRPGPVAFARFVTQCAETLAPLAAQRQVRLDIETSPDAESGVAWVDPDHFDKVVLNLVGNAIRYAPVGSAVEVRIGRDRLLDSAEASRTTAAHRTDGWYLRVADAGPGIAPEHVARVFDPFFQAPGATEGMGLGLAICRDVVLLHGGQISVDSQPGAGASFLVILPPLDEAPAPTTSTPAPVCSADDVRGEELLLVEDDADLRRFLVDVLGRQFVVRTAADGHEAMRAVQDRAPDVIVTDVLMPGLDGIGLCRLLKAESRTRLIPVLMLTARGSREDRLAGLSAGADDYLLKPVDTELLVFKIRQLLRLRAELADRFRASLPGWASILLRTGQRQLDTPSETFLSRFYHVVGERMGDPALDVARLAEALAISRSSLYRQVRDLLATSPMDVITEVRMERAAFLLRTTSVPVASVAEQVGFRNASHFARRFSLHFGLLPTVYRAERTESTIVHQ
jgi:signal transduction histidine kinase/CheY-like chemotaxis protein/AraC-like DNA-binding protein